ncbi:Na+/H+ antiporter subunit E [Marinactinospora thermotolerans]|uniref:Multisubunit sodium/proton antiporter, MrpE subunit n=1 Tax=Marinactinospora thermotolerans DSM 45154 TaxID=1122192 RepID=A0A1T4TEP2_9ACTN|nr:Na+/H+ antiporter subunit E [Marinactinospora thermotolerans]SKA38944.1 multisubunit sodium/proton antiporter, MrpE subunit [Marinactinospora thermotolerans DSM 45154]
MTRPDVQRRPPLAFRLGRVYVQVPSLIAMTVVWALLFGELSVGVVLSGLLVSLAIVLIFPLPPVDPGLRLRPWPFLVFLGRFATDLITASVKVVGQAFAFGRLPRSSVIGVPLRSRSDLLLTMTAVTLSVIPGSVIVEVRYATSTLFVHVLGAADPAAAEAARRDVWALEERITRAFGTREDLARLEGTPVAGGTL